MAGFTTLTENRGDREAADLAEWFASKTRALLGPGDRLVKTLGDAVLITSPTPADGVALVERLFVEAAGQAKFPELRAGLNHGPAIVRDGDVFGAAVNVASRVAAEAYAGEVLGTKPIADAAESHGIPVVELGEVPLKNVREPVKLYSFALVLGADETPIDPVCRVPVDPRVASGYLTHRGRRFYFCSLSCAAVFSSNPGWHAAESMRPEARHR